MIGSDPYSKTEDEVIKEYNSATYLPHLIFLGLHEQKEGFVYKEHYKGAPYFALDVTPHEPIAAAAGELIAAVEAKGLVFSKGRMNLSLPAKEGKLILKSLYFY